MINNIQTTYKPPNPGAKPPMGFLRGVQFYYAPAGRNKNERPLNVIYPIVMEYYDSCFDTSSNSVLSDNCLCGGYYIALNNNFSQYCNLCGHVELIEPEIESNNNTFPIRILGKRSSEFTKELYKCAKTATSDLMIDQIEKEYMDIYNTYKEPPFDRKIITNAVILYNQLQKLIIKRRESKKKSMAACLRYGALELDIALPDKVILNFMDIKGKKLSHCVTDIQKYIDSGEITIGEINITKSEITALVEEYAEGGEKFVEMSIRFFEMIEESYICSSFPYNCRIAGAVYYILSQNKILTKEALPKICDIKNITANSLNNYNKTIAKYKNYIAANFC